VKAGVAADDAVALIAPKVNPAHNTIASTGALRRMPVRVFDIRELPLMLDPVPRSVTAGPPAAAPQFTHW
jgi:hypothetical protein